MAAVSGVKLEVHLRAVPRSGSAKMYVRGLLQYNKSIDRGNGWVRYEDGMSFVERHVRALNGSAPDWNELRRQMWEYYNHTEYEWRVVLSTGDVVVEMKPLS